MKIIHEFRFFKDDFDVIPDAPRDLITKRNNMVVIIVIDQKNKEFKRVLDWAKTHSSVHVGAGPTASFKYSESELKQFEIFYIPYFSMAPSELGSIEYGTKYRTIRKIERQKKSMIFESDYSDKPIYTQEVMRQALQMANSPIEISVQASPLYTDVNKLSKTIDFQQLLSDEVLINARLKNILKENNISGYNTLPVFRPKRIHRSGDDVTVINGYGIESSIWYQLQVVSTAGPIIQPKTQFGPSYIQLKPSTSGVYQYKDEGLISSPKLGSSLYFSRKDFPKTDMVRTKELRIASMPHPYILITQKLYRILIENNIKGFDVKPAFFVD